MNGNNPTNPSMPVFDHSRLGPVDFWNTPHLVRTWLQKNPVFSMNFSGGSEQQAMDEMAKVGFNPNGGLNIDWWVADSLYFNQYVSFYDESFC